MTHITSGLVNRKYNAAVVAPVAANAMMPIRGISCNVHVFKDVVIYTVYIQLSLFWRYVECKHKQKKNLPPSSSSTFGKIQPSLIIKISKFLKNKNSISTERGWNSAQEDEGSQGCSCVWQASPVETCRCLGSTSGDNILCRWESRRGRKHVVRYHFLHRNANGSTLRRINTFSWVCSTPLWSRWKMPLFAVPFKWADLAAFLSAFTNYWLLLKLMIKVTYRARKIWCCFESKPLLNLIFWALKSLFVRGCSRRAHTCVLLRKNWKRN